MNRLGFFKAFLFICILGSAQAALCDYRLEAEGTFVSRSTGYLFYSPIYLQNGWQANVYKMRSFDAGGRDDETYHIQLFEDGEPLDISRLPEDMWPSYREGTFQGGSEYGVHQILARLDAACPCAPEESMSAF